MSPVFAGAVAGMLTASVFVSAGVLMVFSLVREPPPHLAAAARRLSSGVLVFRLVVLAYPTWAFVGALIGLTYVGVERVNPGSGLGSPNLAFTLVVIVTARSRGAAVIPAPETYGGGSRSHMPGVHRLLRVASAALRLLSFSVGCDGVDRCSTG